MALFGSSVAYQVWTGGDAWNYWRFLAPTVPLLVLAGLVQLRAILAAGGAGWRENVVVLAVLGLSMWTLNASFVSEMSLMAPPFDVDRNQRAVNIGLALKETTTEAATLGVFRAGAIPYFAERRSLDFLGKSDPYIAGLPPDLSGAAGAFGMKARPGHSKYDLRYSILTGRPTYLERAHWGGQDLAGLAGEIYVRAFYKGVRLNLLKDSPDVRWRMLDAPE